MIKLISTMIGVSLIIAVILAFCIVFQSCTTSPIKYKDTTIIYMPHRPADIGGNK